MSDAEHIRALNDEIVALNRVGLLPDLGLASRAHLRETVRRVNALVATREQLGQSLRQSIAAEKDEWPRAYHRLLVVGTECGQLPVAMERIVEATECTSRTKSSVAASFLYPLAVAGIALVLLASSCWYLVPVLREFYAVMHVRQGTGMRIMEALRRGWPLWLVVVPFGCAWYLSSLLRPLRAARSWSDWLPGMRNMATTLQCSQVASLAGVLVDRGEPPESALSLASEVPLTGKRFPPLLRWTVTTQGSSTENADRFQFAAEIYRELADEQADRVRLWYPMVAGVIIAGGAVLLYGLSLMVPLRQLLEGLAHAVAR